ncbi:MAG TPA: DUF4433 domain-containing protein [Ignavibacteriaceae bacterium]|jgi:hypothetical protein|nr:MAG: hypothetical protein BWY38_00334 [Ignavibacteria bacterium ADurb.Bin266]OQY74982.1 MAG: hypothetical protein B6D44_02900 [Ignavibacteriales bacterium UTCHB2]HQF42575.1 DUF4433 domain-containing protein [Ignavibacteriaceae bacterium]HQI39476.1 DUF4433 domain-containing protein [Ignavibacteriaceae bacterium]HQJ45122.1 DUF4433 domain-containing protein [Ignavibacteriaceae bacterium]
MPVYIYRIIHRDNLQILIKENKLSAPNLGANPDYISIGETELIRQRGSKQIIISPFGVMRDYISFYFGVRSPMLYCIKNGYDVEKRLQSEIIYLISSIEKLVELNCHFIFTDGHSFAAYTQFFNDVQYLNQLDWKTINARTWNNTESDPDRKRRKEAECLVFNEMPFAAVTGIAVYNQESNDYIKDILHRNNLNIPVTIENSWYY